MADPSKSDLSYGHLGQLSYNVNSGQWQTKRSVRQARVYKAVGQTRVVVPAPSGGDLRDRDGSVTNVASKRHARQIWHVVQRYPEIQPASEIVSPLLRVSEAASTATAKYDPLLGNLLAFGSIPSSSLRTSVYVVALPQGLNGGDLLISRLGIQKHGWDDSKEAWIEVPTLQGEQATWKGTGASIQQMCFADAINGSDTFLAVRLLDRTLLFQPGLGRQATEPTPTIRLNPIIEISIDRTGGLQHADVSLNPWYPRQFGIIDHDGNLTVWEPRAHSRASQVQCLCRCSVEDRSEPGYMGVSDGWARLVWVGGPSTIVACTRSRLAVFDISLPEARPMFKDELKWLAAIRDVIRIPSYPHYLGILTSSHLLVYELNAETGDETTLRLVMSTRHFRSPEDLSLTLQAFSDREDIFMFVRSTLVPLVTQHRMQVLTSNGIMVSDASTFDVSEVTEGLSSASTCLGMHFIHSKFGGKLRATDDPVTANLYRDREVTFQSAMVLNEDMSLTQRLYVASTERSLSNPIAEPSWQSRATAPSSALVKKANFIVDDGDDEDDEAIAYSANYRTRPMSWFMRRLSRAEASRADLRWTVDCQKISHEMETPSAQPARALAEALDLVEGLLKRNQTINMPPIQTLREYSGDRTITDLELASERLRRLVLVQPGEVQSTQQTHDDNPLDEPQPSLRLVLRTLHAPGTSWLPRNATLEQIYDHMVADWISSLSPRIPGSIRLAKERLIRRLAAEIALASRVLRVEDEPQPIDQLQQSLDPSARTGASPLTSRPADSSSQPQPSSQTILPTPSPTATPSVTTQSSHPSHFAAPELSRLSKYTTFSKPPPAALPRSMSRVLAHWTPGADPETYDWLPTSRRIAQREDEDFDSQALTEKERAKLQRRAERHIRRQRREAAASQASQLASSQAMEIVSASQPVQQQRVESHPNAGGGAGGHMPSSQSQGFGAAAASQVMPGRFGGRPPAKKKRKQGF